MAEGPVIVKIAVVEPLTIEPRSVRLVDHGPPRSMHIAARYAAGESK